MISVLEGSKCKGDGVKGRARGAEGAGVGRAAAVSARALGVGGPRYRAK